MVIFLQDFWFKPHSFKTKASGVIELRARNWRKRLPENEKKFVRNKLTETPDPTSVDYTDVIENMPSLWTDKEWLKYNMFPHDVVEEKMKLTYMLRRTDCGSKCISEVFEEWPHLRCEHFVSNILI